MAGNKRKAKHKGKGLSATKWAQTHPRGKKKGGKTRKMKTNTKNQKCLAAFGNN